jgi:hypothetical protein
MAVVPSHPRLTICWCVSALVRVETRLDAVVSCPALKAAGDVAFRKTEQWITI